MTPQDGEQIPLSRPELGEREETLLLEAVRSGRLGLGPMQRTRLRSRAARRRSTWVCGGMDGALAMR